MEYRSSIDKYNRIIAHTDERKIDICCIQEIHLQKDKGFRVREYYKCFCTDRKSFAKITRNMI